MLRPAVAMIELIFALVIMGITLMSAPLLLQQSIKSSTAALQQESVAAAATQINLVMTHAWDESTTEADANRIAFIPLVGEDENTDLNEINRVIYNRDYNINPLDTVASPSSTFGNPDAGEASFDDVDDFHNQVSHIRLYAGETAAFTNNEGDYIDTRVDITTTVVYGSDDTSHADTLYSHQPLDFNNPFENLANANLRSNIKLINVLLRPDMNNQEEESISLSSFVCNIGSSQIAPVQIP